MLYPKRHSRVAFCVTLQPVSPRKLCALCAVRVLSKRLSKCFTCECQQVTETPIHQQFLRFRRLCVFALASMRWRMAGPIWFSKERLCGGLQDPNISLRLWDGVSRVQKEAWEYRTNIKKPCVYGEHRLHLDTVCCLGLFWCWLPLAS